MKKRIFRSTMIAVLAVLLASFIIIMSCLYDYFGGIQENQMKDELSLAAAGVEESGLDYLKDLEYQHYRITWVAEDGTVLFDSAAEENGMENHAGRTEIKSAFASGQGFDIRYSSTLLEKTIYYARRIKDGTVLRISVSRATAGLLLIGMFQPIAVVLLLAVVLSALLAKKAANRITEPLLKLDLDQPLENNAYEELAPLLERIHRQHKQIVSAMKELKKRKDEFAQITQSMNEGLVLLNEQKIILAINPAAQRIFHADGKCVGKDFLTIERSYDVSQALERGIADGHSEIRCQRDGCEYQFDFSRISSDEQTIGTVVLAFDITQQATAERARREFTANVSHELKTPLQSIMGSAELMENGLVKQEDIPRFVGHIRTEAARLVSLIDDIIHLSQMDDALALPMEPVDLYDIAAEAVQSVEDAAAARNITVDLAGAHCTVTGVPRLLFELVYNLCDNAVKYNAEHGSVYVSVMRQGKQVVLSVRDTGIGIPAEHLPRIFERFYRVDKSHSKESGGTGLGLSIVKHAAACHHAKVEIQSEVGRGTEITVLFAAAEKLPG